MNHRGDHRRRWVTGSGAVVVGLALWLALPAAPARAGNQFPPKQVMEAMGFSKDGKEFVLKVVDENLGSLFQVRSSKKNQLVQSYPFEAEDDKRVWRKVRKAHDIAEDHIEGQDNEPKGVSLMTRVKGAELRILMMRGERILPYDKIELMTGKKGEPAEAFVKQVMWDDKGKYVLVVYHQKVEDMFEWEGDFVHAFKFRSYKVKFDADGGG